MMEPLVKNTAPEKLELLVTIVHAKRANYFASVIRDSEANLQLITQASGTSRKAIMDYLGLNQASRVAIFSVVREDKLHDLLDILQEKFTTVKDGGGVAVTVPLSSVIGLLSYGFLSNDKRTIPNE